MDAKAKIDNVVDRISKPGPGTVYVGKEYSTRDLIADLKEVKELLPQKWLFIVHDGREVRRFTQYIPGEILAHFNEMVQHKEQGRIEYLRTALGDDRIRGHAVTFCEPD